jgi:hypothetical protein
MKTFHITSKNITSNLQDDFENIYKTNFDRIYNEYNQIRLENRIDRHSQYPYCFDIVSPSGKKWIVIISKNPFENLYTGVNSIVLTSLCYYIDKSGIMVFAISGLFSIVAYPSYFFREYNEKMNLNYYDELEIVKHFFTMNIRYYQGKHEWRHKKIVLNLIKDGLCLGEESDLGFPVFISFVKRDPQDSFFSTQRDSFRNILQQEIENELNKSDFDRDNYFKLVDQYKELMV